jgi:FkbM family methyltransferase
MTVNTRRLFNWLLPAVEIDAVCDVGSMNGTEALAFRDALPSARIFAFEPNPENFSRMRENATLRTRDIHLSPLAATNHDGDAPLFVVAADYSTVNGYRGMSSLLPRIERRGIALTPVPVRTTRLDSFLRQQGAWGQRLALWIDVEGKGCEVLEGAAGVMPHVQLVHIEVETRLCIGPGQRLYPEIRALLESHGFMELATDGAPSRTQFNGLFVRRELPHELRSRVTSLALLASLRFLVTSTIRGVAGRLGVGRTRSQGGG